MFLLRTGQGKFIVINANIFDTSYLNLKLENYESIDFEAPKTFEHLLTAYKEGLNENACLELMHFLGIFKMILPKVCGESEYFIGPRGNRTSKFDVYFQKKQSNKKMKLYTYYGQEELDYSLCTSNALFIFESKNLRSGGLDLGWHKIAYPTTRFRKLPVPKIPCYFLKQRETIWLFVFPKHEFYNDGIVLNDPLRIIPDYTFKIDLSSL